jgi:hypothetical protein
MDVCQGVEEESRTQICMGYHSEGGIGSTVRAVRQIIIIIIIIILSKN